MELKIVKLAKKEWDEVFAKNAHECVFEEPYDPSTSRADFALLVINPEKDEPIIYTTIAENTSKSATIEYGGSFPNHRGSYLTYLAYLDVLSFLRKDYDQAFMMIRNDNRSMLKFALKSGFTITGFSLGSQGVPLLEHTLNLKQPQENL